jgi:preprotein translocase subunit SecB
MADETPVFQIQRMYLKDLSLEQPNSPQILLEQTQPQVDINLAMGAEPVADGTYEVTVTATVTTKVKDKTLFLVEAKQAGIFEIRNVPEEQMQGIIGIVCPQMIYPYLRAIVSDVCTRAGFPPILLTEVNFQAMFEAQQAQANGGPSIIATAAPQGAPLTGAGHEDRGSGRWRLGHGTGCGGPVRWARGAVVGPRP